MYQEYSYHYWIVFLLICKWGTNWSLKTKKSEPCFLYRLNEFSITQSFSLPSVIGNQRSQRTFHLVKPQGKKQFCWELSEEKKQWLERLKYSHIWFGESSTVWPDSENRPTVSARPKNLIMSGKTSSLKSVKWKHQTRLTPKLVSAKTNKQTTEKTEKQKTKHLPFAHPGTDFLILDP